MPTPRRRGAESIGEPAEHLADVHTGDDSDSQRAEDQRQKRVQVGDRDQHDDQHDDQRDAGERGQHSRQPEATGSASSASAANTVIAAPRPVPICGNTPGGHRFSCCVVRTSDGASLLT